MKSDFNVAEASRALALAVAQKLRESGAIAYFAGGCVRDELLGRVPADYDVATSARPEHVRKLFPRMTQEVGAAFGVVLVRRGGAQVEVATFRSDGAYTDGRRPDSVHFSSPEEDARRRDFTCNGLFRDPIGGEIFDYVNGQEDIRARVIRAIGNPSERFAEDHLRLLRAVRFAARLDFAIEPATLAAMRVHAPALGKISRERIGDELRKILTHPRREASAGLMLQTGLLGAFWPASLSRSEAPYALNPAILERLPERIAFAPAIAALLLDIGPQPLPFTYLDGLQKSLALGNQEKADIGWLLEKLAVVRDWPSQRQATLKRLLADPRWNQLHDLFDAATLDPATIEAFGLHVAKLGRDPIGAAPLVDGNDLIKMGASPGVSFKGWLDTLYDRQLEMEFADRDAALNAARELLAAEGAQSR